MWLQFFLALLVGLLLIFLPGLLFLKSLRLPWIDSLCCGPVITIAFYQIIAIMASALGVDSSWQLLFFVAVAIACVAVSVSSVGRNLVARQGRVDQVLKAPAPSPCKDWLLLVMCVAMASAVTLYVFVLNLDGPESILQEYDNVHHLGLIQAFHKSGDWSPLSTTVYASVSESASIPFVNDSGFYPSAFHCLAAMLMGSVGTSAAMAENVLLTLLCSVVFPLGMFAVMRRVFSDRRILLAGSSVVLAFGAFPWGMLMFGGIFPNLLSNSLVPSMVLFFIAACERGLGNGARVMMVFAFVVSCIGVAFSQPNGVFTAAVILAPYCVWRSGDLASLVSGGSNLGGSARHLVRIISAVVIALIWFGLYKAPFLQSVIEYEWPAICSPAQAVFNALSLSYTVYSLAQPLLAIAVMLGIVYTLWDRKYLWLTGSFAFASVIYVFCAGTNGFLKHFLSGFWYTDPFRVAATASIAGIPLAALGLYCVIRLVYKLMRAITRGEENGKVLSGVALIGLFLLGVYFPNHSVGGYFDVTTAFGNIRGLIEEERSATYANVLDSEELAFAREAEALVPDGAVVANLPDDGSAFLYGLDGFNVYYRSLGGYGGDSETETSSVIRDRLDEVATDSSVAAALCDAGIDYVLLLDQDGRREEGRRFFDSYNSELWSGVNSISDDTLGLELVLSEGDMRLYRIDV